MSLKFHEHPSLLFTNRPNSFLDSYGHTHWFPLHLMRAQASLALI